MPRSQRRTLLLGRAVALSVTVSTAVPARAVAVAQPNMLRVVIASGPHAGTYEPPSAGVICRYSDMEQHFSAAYENFDRIGATALSEAEIDVSNPDDSGPRRGFVRVAFGDAARRPTIYEVSVPKSQAAGLTMTRAGTTGSLAFSGRTSTGIALTLSARCQAIATG